MKRPLESIRIDPLLGQYGTAAATADKVLLNGGQDFSVMIFARVGATLSSGVSGTAANYIDFAVLEGTAASAAGSAITGATVTLGAATAAQCRGVHTAIVRVSSALATNVTFQVNGISYTIPTAGATAVNGCAKLASAINGNASCQKLPHYKAVPEYAAANQILIEPDDDMGTGLTMITTAAAATIAPCFTKLMGCIDVSQAKLSTATPKYIGLSASTFNGTTAVITAFLVRRPSASPCFPGRVVTLAT